MSKLTDIDGTARFTIFCGSNGAGNGVIFLNEAKFYGNGTLLANPTASAFDLDGQGGVAVRSWRRNAGGVVRGVVSLDPALGMSADMLLSPILPHP